MKTLLSVLQAPARAGQHVQRVDCRVRAAHLAHPAAQLAREGGRQPGGHDRGGGAAAGRVPGGQ